MLQIGARTHLTPMHERQRSMKRLAYVDRSMNVSTTANNSPNMPRRSLFQVRMAIGRNDGKKFPERIMNPQRRRRRREGVNRSFIRISTALLWEFHRKYFNTRWYWPRPMGLPCFVRFRSPSYRSYGDSAAILVVDTFATQ